MNASGGHRPSSAIDLKEVNAATVARRQVHLSWQHIFERRTKGADVGESGPGTFVICAWSNPGTSEVVPANAIDDFTKVRRELSSGSMVGSASG